MAQSFTEGPHAPQAGHADRRLRNLIILANALAWVVVVLVIRALVF